MYFLSCLVLSSRYIHPWRQCVVVIVDFVCPFPAGQYSVVNSVFFFFHFTCMCSFLFCRLICLFVCLFNCLFAHVLRLSGLYACSRLHVPSTRKWNLNACLHFSFLCASLRVFMGVCLHSSVSFFKQRRTSPCNGEAAAFCFHFFLNVTFDCEKTKSKGPTARVFLFRLFAFICSIFHGSQCTFLSSSPFPALPHFFLRYFCIPSSFPVVGRARNWDNMGKRVPKSQRVLYTYYTYFYK